MTIVHNIGYMLENHIKSVYENEPIIVILIRDPKSIEVNEASTELSSSIKHHDVTSLISFYSILFL